MANRLLLLVLVTTTLYSITVCDESNDPMVAFKCSRPSMYHTDSGWVKDDSTGCLQDATDILNYCRKVFPSLDIRNVVEASQMSTISNWCDFGVNMCRNEFNVRPYRCLVGAFQSDALLVPEHCVFDHKHDSKVCTTFEEWNKSSTETCVNRGLVQQSAGVLQPCGVGRFNGIEFVCCPKDLASRAVSDAQPKMVSVDESDVSQPVELPAASADDGHRWNEHEYYEKAKADMQRSHSDKVAKMMKDWGAARQRVQDLKKTDPKASEKLNKEITSRFQKMYEAEEVEGELEKKQLAVLHQQRVQAELNDKKLRTMDAYMTAVDDDTADPSYIVKTLRQYMKALEKDRLHIVNRYKHLQDTDPAEGATSLDDMADHLKTLDRQLIEAIDLLDRLPQYKPKIITQIEDNLDSYHSIDSRVTAILLSQQQIQKHDGHSATETSDDVAEDDEEEEEMPEEGELENNEEEDVGSDEDAGEVVYDDLKDATDDVDESVAESQSEDTPHAVQTDASSDTSDASETAEFDEEQTDYVDVKPVEHINNIEKSFLSADEPFIQRSPIKASTFNSSVPIGIAVCSLTIIVIIVAGVVLMRRRRAQLRSHCDLDPNMTSPEERHVASMQMNGYENPTYKYFEATGTTAQTA